MTSKTSDAHKYKIKIGHANFTIIDTPGFGDTRGMAVDQQNFELIKKRVLKAGGINCICVVQSGRVARCDDALKYSYSSLTTILPKAIENQIIFVYSNCKTYNDITFEHQSLNPLFGFEKERYIDRVWFDNPITYLLKFQE
jgi:hypothetical protein